MTSKTDESDSLEHPLNDKYFNSAYAPSANSALMDKSVKLWQYDKSKDSRRCVDPQRNLVPSPVIFLQRLRLRKFKAFPVAIHFKA